MREETSIYLDLARFVAALEVFLVHAKRESITGGFLHLFGQFGDEAVAVFFVISGIVISQAVAKRETSPDQYFVARLSRLWSVVVPAIVLTILLDLIGRTLAPEVYAVRGLPPPWHFDLNSLWSALAPILFLNQIWFWGVEPGTNAPFWSLCYEFWYYMGFAVACFVRGWSKSALLILIALLVGPKIVFLAPIWVIGVLARSAFGKLRGPVTAAIAWIASGVGLIAVLALKYRLFGPMYAAGGFAAMFALYYPVAILFAINLIAFDGVAGTFAGLARRSAPIVRFCAARTFSLYLYQAPLLFFAGALTFHQHNPVVKIVVAYAGTILTVFLLAQFTEMKRPLLAKQIKSAFALFATSRIFQPAQPSRRTGESSG